jgi:NADH:ubiquinone oxidoreductase subunit F (NADH-binding)
MTHIDACPASPAPGVERRIRVCTGGACVAVCGEDHVAAIERGLGLGLGERCDERRLSLAETGCLGFCHSAPAVRDGDVVDAGSGVVRRVLVGAPRQAREPTCASVLPQPVLIRRGDWSGLGRALRMARPEELLEEVKAANLRDLLGRRLAVGPEWERVRDAPREPKLIVAKGNEGELGGYIEKYLMEHNHALLLEGMALAGYAVGARHGLVLCPTAYPLAKPAIEAEIERAHADGLLGERILGTKFSFDISVDDGAVRDGRSDTSLLPTVVNHVETLCNLSYIAFYGAGAYRALSPGASPGSKLVCFNERLRRPGVYEVRFGTTIRELCEELAGGLVGCREIKAVQIGGPLGGILPAKLLDTPFDFDELEAVGCVVGNGEILAFDDQSDMGDAARHLLRFAPKNGQGSALMHSLLTHFPDELRIEAAAQRSGRALPLGPKRSARGWP